MSGHPGSYHDLLSEKKYQQLLKKLQSSSILYTPTSVAYESRKTKSKPTRRRLLTSLSKLYHSPCNTVSRVQHQNVSSKRETKFHSFTASTQSKKKLVVANPETVKKKKKKKKVKKSLKKEKKNTSFRLRDSDGDDSDGDLSTEISSRISSSREAESQVSSSNSVLFKALQWKKSEDMNRALSSGECDASEINKVNPKLSTWNGLRYKIKRGKNHLVRKLLDEHGFRRTKNDNWDLLWSSSRLSHDDFRSIESYQKVNRFPEVDEITRKDNLHYSISRMAQLYGKKHFDFVPQTFVFPADRARFEQISTEESCRGDNPLWIVKPTSSSQGRGIFVTNDMRKVPRKNSWICSRYIKDPCLINGRKFDLRLFVLVTSFDPLRLYVFKDGLVRIAAERYSTDAKHLSNRFAHLTNYSLNKLHREFVRNDDGKHDDVGNKWSLKALFRHLREAGYDDRSLWKRMNDIIIKTILSIQRTVNSSSQRLLKHRGSAFEILGFDVLIDSKLKPWLLEVNQSPSLQCGTPLDLRIKSAMLAEALNIVSFAPAKCSRVPDCGQNKFISSSFSSFNQESYERTKLVSPSLWVWGKDPDDEEVQEVQKEILLEAQNEAAVINDFEMLFPTPQWCMYRDLLEGCRTINESLCKSLFGEDRNKTPREAVKNSRDE